MRSSAYAAAIAVCLVVVARLAPARADAPSDVVARPLVLREHELAAAITVEVNLEPGSAFAPLSVAPDLWFGATARWTLGIIHSDATIDRIGGGAGVCVDAACGRPYHGGGGEARWSWRTGDLAIAARARFLVREITPIEPAVTLGALARWTRGRFAITSDPYLRVGLANRDMNPPAVVVPLWFEVQPASRCSVGIHSGWGSSLPVAPEAWHIPFALDLRARITGAIDIAGEAGFTSLLGPANRMQERSIAVSVSWHD